MDWLSFPDKIWVSILCNLSERSLLNASETCKRFNNLISTSQRLINRLCLKIENRYEVDDEYYVESKLVNENETSKTYRELKLLRECLQKSKRKYKSIIISYLKDYNERRQCNYNIVLDILKLFAGNVTQLTFSNTSLKDDNFFEVIDIMKNLKHLKFEGQTFVKISISKKEWQHIVSGVDEITIEYSNCFLFRRLYMFDNLTTLNVENCIISNFEYFEHFLSLQKKLKVLNLGKLRKRELFSTDKLLSNIKFSLDVLCLNVVYWNDNIRAMKFFKTQTNLKEVKLHFRNYWWCQFDEKKWYNELLVHLFDNNPHLKTVYLSTDEKHGYNIKDFSFLEGIVNTSVENLTLYLDPAQDANEFIHAFTKLFPNVKNFTYEVNNLGNEDGLDMIQNWKALKSLNCCSVLLYEEDVNLSEDITTLTITYFCEDDSSELIEFLTRHQNIKHLLLTSYDDSQISDEIIVMIVNTIKSLETLKYDDKNYPIINYLELG